MWPRQKSLPPDTDAGARGLTHEVALHVCSTQCTERARLGYSTELVQDSAVHICFKQASPPPGVDNERRAAEQSGTAHLWEEQ
jgi:hypothetical protein